MKRLNKEYKLDICDGISVKYGSVNREDPQVIYISGKCWISPLCKMDYSTVLSSIKENMKKDVKRNLIDNVNFDGKFIFDFDVSTEKIEPNCKKFLTFDLYARQKRENKKNLKELKCIMAEKMDIISNNLVRTLAENDFSVSQRKG